MLTIEQAVACGVIQHGPSFSPVYRVESAELTYVRLHLCESAADVVTCVAPFVGKVTEVSIPNDYGYEHLYVARLLGARDSVVRVRPIRGCVWTQRIGRSAHHETCHRWPSREYPETELDAFKAFSAQVNMVIRDVDQVDDGIGRTRHNGGV